MRLEEVGAIEFLNPLAKRLRQRVHMPPFRLAGLGGPIPYASSPARGGSEDNLGRPPVPLKTGTAPKAGSRSTSAMFPARQRAARIRKATMRRRGSKPRR